MTVCWPEANLVAYPAPFEVNLAGRIGGQETVCDIRMSSHDTNLPMKLSRTITVGKRACVVQVRLALRNVTSLRLATRNAYSVRLSRAKTRNTANMGNNSGVGAGKGHEGVEQNRTGQAPVVCLCLCLGGGTITWVWCIVPYLGSGNPIIDMCICLSRVCLFGLFPASEHYPTILRKATALAALQLKENCCDV